MVESCHGFLAVCFQGVADADVWVELDGLLRMRCPHPAGGLLKVDAACIDAGDGAMMDTVTAFCAPRLGKRVFATKGAPGFGRASIIRSKSGKRPLFILGVDGIKTRLFDKLAKGNSVRFSHTLPAEWYEQLSSERRVMRVVRGKLTMRFERKPGFAAEALDATVYARAAKAALTLNFDLREDEMRTPPPLLPKPPMPTVIRSQWMNC